MLQVPLLLVQQLQMDVAGLLAGVDDEVELLAGQLEVPGRAELGNGIAGCEGGVLFKEIHTITSIL